MGENTAGLSQKALRMKIANLQAALSDLKTDSTEALDALKASVATLQTNVDYMQMTFPFDLENAIDDLYDSIKDDFQYWHELTLAEARDTAQGIGDMILALAGQDDEKILQSAKTYAKTCADNLATEALTPAEIESAWAAAEAEATEEASASTTEEAPTTNVNQQPINHNNQ